MHLRRRRRASAAVKPAPPGGTRDDDDLVHHRSNPLRRGRGSPRNPRVPRLGTSPDPRRFVGHVPRRSAIDPWPSRPRVAPAWPEVLKSLEVRRKGSCLRHRRHLEVESSKRTARGGIGRGSRWQNESYRSSVGLLGLRLLVIRRCIVAPDDAETLPETRSPRSLHQVEPVVDH